MNDSKWVSTKERLPVDGQKVIILVQGENIQVAIYRKGKTLEECSKIGIFSFCDQSGNNLVPYAWKAHGGPMQWFGQEITHWMELPSLPENTQ